jgi:MerR family transcriptional regulator, light-induced transcriptional regulator
MAEPVHPRGGHLWTSAEVARAFRVGVSSIKRWTDEGELEAVRTPGKHRRYSLPALYRFASIRNLATEFLPPFDQAELFEEIPLPADVTLLDARRKGDTENVRGLVTPHVDTLVQRAAFLDRVVGDALREIGRRWDHGLLGVDEEHRAAHMIAEAIDRQRPRLVRSGKLAILACPPGEWHDLPLRLVRLIFEWSGWRTEFAGAQLPWNDARAAVDRTSPTILAFSARSSEPFQSAEFEKLTDYCRECRVTLITGGEWARGGTGGEKGYYRFRTLRGFEKWLRSFSPIAVMAPVGTADRGLPISG